MRMHHMDSGKMYKITSSYIEQNCISYGNYTRMLRAILNKSWREHPTRHQLYSHQPPITKTIQGRRTRHAGHWWRSRDGFISDVLLWTPTYGRAKEGQPGGGDRGVMVIVVGNGNGYTSSNPGRDWLHFT